MLGDDLQTRTQLPWRFDAPSRLVPASLFERPVLVVVVDTEEEFDWNASFDRGATGVSHMAHVERFQAVCDESGVRPIYVVDHPIATQRTSVDALRAIHARGGCEIGAHLHPWVSPPFEEVVDARNSYPGNLPRALERAKLMGLCDAIERSFGVRPTSYKAGRYGFGPHTAELLSELGFDVDLSACPPFDFGDDGGPDWSRSPAQPYFVRGGARELLVVPQSGAYLGWAGAARHAWHRAAHTPLGRRARLGGIFARVGAVERLFLSPEGYAPEDHRRLTRELLARGVRVVSFSLHSPSFEVGHTPYVQSEEQLHSLLDSCRSYFRFFLGELGGVACTPRELHAQIDTAREASDA